MSPGSTTFGSWDEAVRWLRDQPERAQLVRDAYYDDPLIDAATRYWRSDEWRALRPHLPAPGGAALDIGAGRGIASFALAKDGFRVSALEPDGSALVGAAAIRELAAGSGLPIEVTQEFSERLPFPNASFDLVFARAVLHHTRDLQAACAEFHRVLKPGGRLLAIREHVISRNQDLPAFLDAHPLHKLYGGENAFLLDVYLQALRQSGLQVERVLAPLESAVNFAPYTLRTLQREIAKRVAPGIPGAAAAVRGLFCVPGAWPALRSVLARVDHRPGRLYSFIARKR